MSAFTLWNLEVLSTKLSIQSLKYKKGSLNCYLVTFVELYELPSLWSLPETIYQKHRIANNIQSIRAVLVGANLLAISSIFLKLKSEMVHNKDLQSQKCSIKT